MDDAALSALVANMRAPGWGFRVSHADRHRFVRADASIRPADRDDSGAFGGLGEHFVVPASWEEPDVVVRLFTALQFLTDHELREGFTVRGTRPFDAHAEGLTGAQHDWFVERRAALRGHA